MADLQEMITEAVSYETENRDVEKATEKKLAKAFSSLFGAKTSFYTKIRDFSYSDQHEEDKDRRKDFIDSTANLLNLIMFAGDPESVMGYLKDKHGIEVIKHKPPQINTGEVEKVLRPLYGDDWKTVAESPESVLRNLVAGGVDVKTKFEENDNQIKALAEVASKQTDISTQAFTKLVKIKYKQNSGKSVDKDLEKLDSQATSYDTAYETANKMING